LSLPSLLKAILFSNEIFGSLGVSVMDIHTTAKSGEPNYLLAEVEQVYHEFSCALSAVLGAG
jgi:hypothetical protein